MNALVLDRHGVAAQPWGAGCRAWPLVDLPDLSVKHELLPAGAGEQLHVHARARQFFLVLSGTACFELGGTPVVAGVHQGVAIAPGTPHTVQAAPGGPLEILVVSAPSTRGDRRSLGGPCASA